MRGAAGCRLWANSGGAGRALGAERRGCTGLLLPRGSGTCGRTGSIAEASCLGSRPPPSPSLQPILPLLWGSGWQGGERLWHASTSLHARGHTGSRQPYQHGLCTGWLQPQGSWCLWQMIRKCPENILVLTFLNFGFCCHLNTFLRRMRVRVVNHCFSTFQLGLAVH